MHQKKSEVQIGKESSGVSSDFNPTPPLFLFPSSIHQKHQQSETATAASVKVAASAIFDEGIPQILIQNDPITPSPSPYKRPHHHSSSLAKSPTLYQLNTRLGSSSPQHQPTQQHDRSLFSVSVAAKSAAFRLLRRFRHFRRLRVHLRLVLLLSLPFFYFLVSHPSHSFLLDFLSAFAFSAALLFSLNLALPRLPSIRLFLARSFPIKLASASSSTVSKPPLPVFWSIGSRPKLEKKGGNSGCWVQVYSNGDVYEGEYHKGKCSGSGVYYYYMSGRYEGDWVDGKYDGYGVETWARGSRYRGQYRQGLRHGFGVRESGLTSTVMAAESILVRMGVAMLANSSGASSMGLAITISEMGTHVLENILQTRCMALVSTTLPMGIDMQVEDKDLECTLAEWNS